MDAALAISLLIIPLLVAAVAASLGYARATRREAKEAQENVRLLLINRPGDPTPSTTLDTELAQAYERGYGAVPQDQDFAAGAARAASRAFDPSGPQDR